MSEKVQLKPKPLRSTSVSSDRQTDCNYCMMPATPLVPPIVHTATYRMKSVEHFQQVIKEVKSLEFTEFSF